MQLSVQLVLLQGYQVDSTWYLVASIYGSGAPIARLELYRYFRYVGAYR